MKIAIVNLTDKGISGGYREYLLNVIPLLASDVNTESLLCVSLESLGVDKWFKPMHNVKFTNYLSYDFFSQRFYRSLQQKMDQFSPDVIFVPTEKPIKFKKIPVVTMIQNMEPFTRDSDGGYSLTEKLKRWLQYAAGKTAVKNAARVVAISEFVRDFLINTLHVSGDKIALIRHGLAFDKNKILSRPRNIHPDWDNKFIFTAGSIRPARGLKDLIIAAKNINFDSSGIKGVVIAGEVISDMLKYRDRLLNLAKVNNLASRFIFLNEIDSSQMEWCYKNCKLFVATSRVESFGMVGLEAMANGCLAVAADNPCLPEIFRDCAVYYKPKDVLNLADVINSVLSWQENKKAAMSQKARERAMEFSWKKTADALIRELQVAVKIGRGR
jgi:glycosyltransferase involved in cell wall biosynthesis